MVREAYYSQNYSYPCYLRWTEIVSA